MTALQTLRSLNRALGKLQDEASTGLRISEASHNAAYWSISVSMKSTVGANKAIMDSLGLTTALVDVTYAAVTQIESNLSLIKDKLVLAQTDGIDMSKIQADIRQIAEQIVTAVDSATFAGRNLLRTDIEELWEAEYDDRTTKYPASYSSGPSGVRVGTIDIDHLKISMFNEQGGGILEVDPRSPLRLGGIRNVLDSALQIYNGGIGRGAQAGRLYFDFGGPFTLDDDDYIRFTLEVDSDSPSHGLPGPLTTGPSSVVEITKADIVAHFPSSNGTINTWTEWVSLLNTKLNSLGVSVMNISDGYGGLVPDYYVIQTREILGLDGSSVKISDVQSSVGNSHGIVSGVNYGSDPAWIDLSFTPFKIYKDVVATMDFFIHGEQRTITIDRDTVDTLLGKDDGKVETAAEMATILDHLIGDFPNLIIEQTGTTIRLSVDKNVDRRAGSIAQIGFRNTTVNIEPIAAVGLLDIDLVANPNMAKAYLHSIEAMHEKSITAAAYLGSVKNRVEMQKDFTSHLNDALERGIGQLIDADMEKTAAKLQAEQVRQQLAIQALSISNQRPQAILRLFTA